MRTRIGLLLCMVGASGYSQSPGTFTETGSMTTARCLDTATLLANGKVLIAGGLDSTCGGSAFVSAELYDPSTGLFSAAGNMTMARRSHSATLLADGRVLIAGGYASYPFVQPLTGAELYDPSTGTFTATGDMLTSGSGTAILLADGRVLIAHDEAGSRNPPTHAELYDPVTGAFSATGDQRAISPGFADETRAALLPDGKVILVSCCNPVQLYDPASGTFSLKTVTTLLQDLNFNFTMTLLTNGKVLLAGGFLGQGCDACFNAYLLDPATGTYSATGNMTARRDGHSATPLPDGTVLIAGGLQSESSADFSATAELYDPATATFSRTGDMTTRRYGQTATLLLDGRVLIAGGDLSAGTSASAELYTPTKLVPAPALFSLSGDGRGQGAIWHSQTGQIASADNPAIAGEALSMYTTSLADDGVIPPQVSIGGRLAQVLYFGASGYPGYNQVNVRVPSGVAPGDSVPVRLTYLGRPSNAVTIGVQ
jgi:hypothetical protein